MASVKGNRDALEDVLLGMFPQVSDARLVQEKISDARSPFFSKYFAAGVTTWQLIECAGYEVLILAGDEVQQLGSSPAYLRFGSAGPASTSAAADPAAVPVVPGTRIKVPQGCSKIWFLPDSAVAWRVVVIRVPHVEFDYGPYGYRAPGQGYLSQSIVGRVVAMPSTAPTDSGNQDTIGVAVPARARSVAVHVGDGYETNFVRLPTTMTADVTMELWWLPVAYATDGYGIWAHNPADDFDAAGKGAGNAAHDAERYSCEGMSRIYCRQTGTLPDSGPPGSGPHTIVLAAQLVFFG